MQKSRSSYFVGQAGNDKNPYLKAACRAASVRILCLKAVRSSSISDEARAGNDLPWGETS